MTDDVRDLLINIVAGILLIGLGALGRALLGLWLYRSERRLWKSFRGSPQLQICLTTRAGPYPRSTQRVSLAEVRAVAEVTPILERLKIRYKLMPSTNSSDSSLGNHNPLILGSTFVKEVARRAVELLGPRLPAVVTEDPREVVVSNRHYGPQYADGSQRVLQDHALIVRAHNPYDPTGSRWMFLIMGCHGFGTAGASRLLTQETMSRTIQSTIGDGAFAAIVSVKVVGETYQASVVEAYALPGA